MKAAVCEAKGASQTAFCRTYARKTLQIGLQTPCKG